MSGIRNLALSAAAAKCVVQEGPFSGMTVLPESHGGDGDVAAMWLSLYEQELHPCLSDLASRPPTDVINLGAGDGFYAIGLALAYPNANITAFDVSETAAASLYRNGEANGVANRIVHGRCCEPEQLIEMASRSTAPLLVCDIEGGKVDLLSAPGVIEALGQCDAFIECYESAVEFATTRICNLFYDSHDVFVVTQSGRDPDTHPFLTKLHANDRSLSVSENRPKIARWVYCRSRRGHPLSMKPFEMRKGNILAVSRYSASNPLSTIFVGMSYDERCVMLGDTVGYSSATGINSGHATLTFISKSGKLRAASRFEPVVWTCAYGSDDYFQCLQLCLESLYKFGEYRGKVCVFSDRTHAETLAYVPASMRRNAQILPISRPPSWMTRYDCAKQLPDLPGPYLYIDTDVIFDAPIEPILLKVHQSRVICFSTETKYYPQFERPIADLRGRSPLLFEWFGLEIIGSDGRFNDRHLLFVNSGIFGAGDIGTLRYFCELLQGVVDRVDASYIARFTDQAAVNYVLMQTGEWNGAALTPHVCFARAAAKRIGARLGFYHICWSRGTDKVSEMKSYLDQLRICSSAGELNITATAGSS